MANSAIAASVAVPLASPGGVSGASFVSQAPPPLTGGAPDPNRTDRREPEPPPLVGQSRGNRQEPTAAPGTPTETSTNANTQSNGTDTAELSDASTGRKPNGEPLTDAEQKQVEQLRERDREVRAHEQAHKNAAGQYATSGPTYEYQQGPDGKRYAVGGSVGIDLSEEETPEETIQKMQVVRRAALAPAEPSSQDRKVAAQATQIAQEAQAELAQERTTERDGETDSSNAPGRASNSAEFVSKFNGESGLSGIGDLVDTLA